VCWQRHVEGAGAAGNGIRRQQRGSVRQVPYSHPQHIFTAAHVTSMSDIFTPPEYCNIFMNKYVHLETSMSIFIQHTPVYRHGAHEGGKEGRWYGVRCSGVGGGTGKRAMGMFYTLQRRKGRKEMCVA